MQKIRKKNSAVRAAGGGRNLRRCLRLRFTVWDTTAFHGLSVDCVSHTHWQAGRQYAFVGPERFSCPFFPDSLQADLGCAEGAAEVSAPRSTQIGPGARRRLLTAARLATR